MTRRIDKPDTAADIELRKYIDTKINFIMVAGAGSGKTTSLVKALDYIRKIHGGVLRKQGQRVACITYTTVAEHEIWSDVGQDPLFHISTIHSFLWELIKPFQTEIKAWVIQRIQERLKELNEQKQNFNNRHKQSTKDKNQRDIIKYQELLDNINCISHFRYETGSNYLQGILGHDDIIKMTPALIKERPLLRTIFSQKYPFLFIDESQDTIPEVVDAVKTIASNSHDKFCLGFFGDEMQKIYLTGIGKIEVEKGWKKITKPENFRCPTNILNVINKIRNPIDGLAQTAGKIEKVGGVDQPIMGSARLFLFSYNTDRNEALKKVRECIANTEKDPLWLSEEKRSDVKVLVIEHRMAANRLGFSDLYATFKDNTPKSLSEDFTEGRTWAFKPFLDYLLPLVEAFESGKSFAVMELLRQYCPLLKRGYLEPESSTNILQLLKNNIHTLSELMAKNNTIKVLDILEFAHINNLIILDERILQRICGNTPLTLLPEVEEEGESLERAILAYFDTPVNQLWGYQTYINDQSPFSTQHSIKGAEFNRVLVVLDDEEAKKSTLYSYDKLLGIKSPSDTDRKNLSEGKETVFDRTRRLFYVCCSRAKKDLAVVFFVSETDIAAKQIKSINIFEQNSIFIL